MTQYINYEIYDNNAKMNELKITAKNATINVNASIKY